MDDTEKMKNLGRNLTALCKSYNSVAEVCRRIGINRQQFNKYLAGKHLPSTKVRAVMAQFFSIDEDDLTKSPAKFDAILDGPRIDISWKMRSSEAFRRFLPSVKSSGEEFRGYYGVYYRYHNSSIHKGRVLRSIFYLYEHNGVAQYVIMERFPQKDGSKKLECSFKYHGFALLTGNRIFLFDFESVQRNEFTFSIFLPRHRNLLQVLFGVVTGIAATPLREPFSTRVALEFKGAGPVKKAHLQMAKTLSPDDPAIPPNVKAFLGSTDSSIIWGYN